MNRWRNIGSIYYCWPYKVNGLIEIIGGSYLATNPHITYRRLLDGLVENGLAVHAWSYIPSFDHQAQSNKAWKDFRSTREFLFKRFNKELPSIRLGHSLGCKLHLLAPDSGRISKSFIGLSFNNYSASKSIPMIKKLTKGLGIQSEFSPSPRETISLIRQHYLQEDNLLVTFKNDMLDQSSDLLKCLKNRVKDNSELYVLDGDHLTPASFGLRKKFIGKWADNNSQATNINYLIKIILEYSQKTLLS